MTALLRKPEGQGSVDPTSGERVDKGSFADAVIPPQTGRTNVNGPPLTPQEAVASIAWRVRRLEAQGLDREQAIHGVAAETGIEPRKVRWCAGHSFPDSTVHLLSSVRGRRSLLEMTAAA